MQDGSTPQSDWVVNVRWWVDDFANGIPLSLRTDMFQSVLRLLEQFVEAINLPQQEIEEYTRHMNGEPLDPPSKAEKEAAAGIRAKEAATRTSAANNAGTLDKMLNDFRTQDVAPFHRLVREPPFDFAESRKTIDLFSSKGPAGADRLRLEQKQFDRAITLRDRHLMRFSKLVGDLTPGEIPAFFSRTLWMHRDWIHVVLSRMDALAGSPQDKSFRRMFDQELTAACSAEKVIAGSESAPVLLQEGKNLVADWGHRFARFQAANTVMDAWNTMTVNKPAGEVVPSAGPEHATQPSDSLASSVRNEAVQARREQVSHVLHAAARRRSATSATR